MLVRKYLKSKSVEKSFPPSLFNCRLTEKHDETLVKSVGYEYVQYTGTIEIGKSQE